MNLLKFRRRRVHSAEAVGYLASNRPFPKAVGPSLSSEHTLLDHFVEEERESQRPNYLRETLDDADNPTDCAHFLVALAMAEKSDECRLQHHEFLERHPQERDDLRATARRIAVVLDRFVGIRAERRPLVPSLPVLAAEGIDV